MGLEQTLSILKPDTVASQHIGEVLQRFEKNQLRIIGMKMMRLTEMQAKKFYAIHAQRPFFAELVSFITEGPVVVLVLEGENAVAKNRALMGATDPKKAEKGTIRADFASSIDRNAVHGSDSLENAKQEVSFFFTPQEIFPTR